MFSNHSGMHEKQAYVPSDFLQNMIAVCFSLTSQLQPSDHNECCTGFSEKRYLGTTKEI
jgi:hypothetical protein